MNKVVNKFLLTGNKSISEMHLKQLGFTYSTYGTFTKKKELHSLCKQEIQIIFTRMILTKILFNMIWLMINIKNYYKNRIG